jgi:hypothetical protein
MELDKMASKQVCQARCAEYRRAGKKERGRILDEIVRVSKGNRDYWATKLRNYNRAVFAEVEGQPVKYVARDRKRGEKHGGGRPRKYTADFTGVLENLWLDFGQRSPKRFLPDVREMIDYLCADSRYGITSEIREKLLVISPAQADRVLASARKKQAVLGLSTTRPAKLTLRSQVPVCTYHDRATTKPGIFSSDTVAHCGSDASGQFCKSLTMRDISSGWYEGVGFCKKPRAAERRAAMGEGKECGDKGSVAVSDAGHPGRQRRGVYQQGFYSVVHSRAYQADPQSPLPKK